MRLVGESVDAYCTILLWTNDIYALCLMVHQLLYNKTKQQFKGNVRSTPNTSFMLT